MLKSGIISKDKIIEINNGEIIPYLNSLLNCFTQEEKLKYETFKSQSLIVDEMTIVKYFVEVLSYIIVIDNSVYYQSSIDDNIIDKIEYIKNGFELVKLSKHVMKNGKFIRYKSEDEMTIERLGFEHSMSEENDLSFWYPKTQNIGFVTPETLIINFLESEVKLIKARKWDKIYWEAILERIYDNYYDSPIKLENELFVRFGTSSNKFNFNTCHINHIDLDELYPKMMTMFENMYPKLEWLQNINLVLREYIKANYERDTIYNGLPLNTEFRVFYDFDTSTILGIYNYWDKNTMLDNLSNKSDLITFANNADIIEKDFNELKPRLETEISRNLPNTNMSGKWSIDFLFDGNNFVLIDMAHAECSYYYDKVLSKQH